MKHYAILGGGRLARHMGRYLSLLQLSYSGWARNPASPLNTHIDTDHERRLRKTVQAASHVLVLVSDAAIAPLVQQYPFLRNKRLVHCAGAISIPGVAGAHPLMTFAREMYSLDQYRRIPFVVELPHQFDTLLPGLPNPSHAIDSENKALYHALCVMAGNFPQILWSAVMKRFTGDLALPDDALREYLHQSVDNICNAPENALTGPLSRDDRETINKNLAALPEGGLAELYRAFLRFHKGNKPTDDLKERVA